MSLTAKTRRMTGNEISSHIVDAAIEVHRHLGSGLLESIYEKMISLRTA